MGTLLCPRYRLYATGKHTSAVTAITSQPRPGPWSRRTVQTMAPLLTMSHKANPTTGVSNANGA
jgi:hypothetical protein